MKEKPLVSVIIPVYNTESYLPLCMETVLGQTWRELEILLVDDGSGPECAAMCDEYAADDSRIIVIHKQNGGLSSARNYGIARAKGEFIIFPDPDDWAEPEYLEREE